MSDLKTLLAPVSRFVAALDLADGAGAERALRAEYPPGSPEIEAIRTAAEAALEGGSICDRGDANMRFSRLIKPQDDAAGCSVDAVFMRDSSGPFHSHAKGEVCLCFPRSGSPRFEGRADTWVVMHTGSRHAPTVTDGAMLILYWWPGGAVVWG